MPKELPDWKTGQDCQWNGHEAFIWRLVPETPPEQGHAIICTAETTKTNGEPCEAWTTFRVVQLSTLDPLPQTSHADESIVVPA